MNFNKIHCEFCTKQCDLEFQTCYNDQCRKIFCFECYSRFYNECPFCILRSKNKGNDNDEVESLEADSSDEELKKHEDSIEDYDYIDGDEEDPLIDMESSNIENTLENPSQELVNKNVKDEFASSVYGNKKLYIHLLNTIQKKVLQRSIMKPKNIENIIEQKTEIIFENIQNHPNNSYLIENFKEMLLKKNEIIDLFHRHSYEIYNSVSEKIFDNIVNAIELNEYFNVKTEVKSDKLFNYLNDIKKSMTDS